MHKFLFLLVLFFTFIKVQAQETQWVSTILEASSEIAPKEYSAEQIIGKPDVTPGAGESPNAWMPFWENREEYVKVGFEKPFKIRQITIAESFNPSAIYQIYLYDRSDNEFLINTFNPHPIALKSRMLHVFFDLTEYEVAAVKVVLHCGAVPGYNAIDAIAISNSTLPVKQEVKILESAIVNVNPDRLSETVNSVYNELRPLVTPDEKTLLFSRQFHPGNTGGEDDPEDIWFSQWDEEKGEWMEAVNMGAPLNTKGPNFISSITPDGNTVIITLGNRYTKNGKMKAGVSVSTRTSEGWSKPVPFEIINGINMHQKSNYFLANNREVLLMSVEADPTFGSRDLYVSFLLDDGRWSEPLNLGSDVNTALEEGSPFLAPDDLTLYFSSDGYTGYGKHDIYVSRRLDESWTKWSEPENLGPQINSPEDDAFFNIPPTGEYGYFSRNFSESNSDIFRFELPKEHQPEAVVTVKGVVYNTKTRRPIQARIFYESLPEGKEIGTIESDPLTGEYQIILPSGKMYGYLAEAEGFVAINANIDLKETEEYGEVNKNLFLVPIEKGAVVRLNNIFFDFDKYELKQESFPELNRIIELLNKNKEMSISVEGHTDNIGTREYNITLSERRAKAVVDYLIKGGISKDRLQTKGWGKSKPIVSNDDEIDGRELNRRVNFRILEE
ncbi:MAG: OmpA family protein [Cyclobacteriaceae bacterium]|nr:OmpA family protein [Cyclobacteriaceae bacterium]